MTLVVGVAAGCSSSPSRQRPGPPTMADVATAIGAAPLLHWAGSWRAYGQSMTLDLRAMGDGDAVGTLTDHGDRAQVLVVDGTKVMLKGGKAYWRHGGTPAADVARFAGHWVDEDGSVWGARLGGLSPRALSKTIKSDNQTGASDSPAILPWTPAPATAATPRPTPSGVPSGALRFTVDQSISSLGEGTFWASGASPHGLLAYSGVGLPGDDENDTSVKRTTLSVRAGGADDAHAAYTELTAQVRTLPETMAVQDGLASHFEVDKVDLPPHCRSGGCRVKVTGHNAETARRTVRATVTVFLYGSKSMSGGGGKKVAACHVRMPPATHDKTVHGSCDMTDPRIDRYWDSVPGPFLKIAYWNETHAVSGLGEEESLDPAALATELTARTP
ncbi:hypothetical protein [Actinomadura sp. DC4]|uniref:hypothetical protein n=1 Tax=Actinomadura sp. DC4 TaxID=3055069 RepID=UPI0025B0DA44|nr:hypothetical protein [Actinomadura sp. DC4]MDN3357241.1 hypothetical protein [Actinomadura sp. DC4]